MDKDKWIVDMKYIMGLSIRDKEQNRRFMLICTQSYVVDDLCVDEIDACMCYDEILKYGHAMQYWVDIYNKYYNTNVEVIKKKHRKFFYWVTCTGKKRINDNSKNIELMHKFGLNIFNNNNYKRYYKVHWNVEVGKHKDKPNVHVHALVIFDSTNKNFKRDFCNAFKKIFNDYDYKESRFVMKLQDIYKDKYNYLNNINKSILHQNYRDTGIIEHLEC